MEGWASSRGVGIQSPSIRQIWWRVNLLYLLPAGDPRYVNTPCTSSHATAIHATSSDATAPAPDKTDATTATTATTDM